MTATSDSLLALARAYITARDAAEAAGDANDIPRWKVLDMQTARAAHMLTRAVACVSADELAALIERAGRVGG